MHPFVFTGFRAEGDESVFQAADRFDPERFLPGRPPVPVLSFGAGRHACPGRPLASAIIAEALRRLAGDEHPAVGDIERHDDLTL